MIAKWLAKKKLTEKHPLPTGVKEFHEWADRIIAGAGLTATIDSQKYTLANLIVNNCAPNIAFETDVYFIHFLRKHAANQVAVAMREEIFERVKKQKEAEATPPVGKDAEESAVS